MENMQDIVKILEQQVINKTLSLEGIEQVQKIITENKQLTDRNERLEKQYDDKAKQYDEMYQKYDDAERKLSEANKELQTYREKDKQYYEQGIKFQYEQQRGNEFKDFLGMALRNTEIRQSMFGNQPMVDPLGNYITSWPKDETTTTTQE